MNSRLCALLPLLWLCACASPMSLAPGAEAIRLTRAPDEVRDCKVLGSVDGLVGVVDGDSRHDPHQLLNKALGLDADTVFVTSPGASVAGIAYRCAKSAAKSAAS